MNEMTSIYKIRIGTILAFCLALLHIPFISLSLAGESADISNMRCQARLHAAGNAVNILPEYTIAMCKDILTRGQPGYSNQVWALIAEARIQLKDPAGAADAFHQSGNIMREAEQLFNAGKYAKAGELFTALLSLPESQKSGMAIDKVGYTPPPVILRIWLARCKGRLGDKSAAVNDCLGIIREVKHQWPWWNDKDKCLIAKTIVENVHTDAGWAAVREIAKSQKFRELQEYFDASELVNQSNAVAVVKYLVVNDENVCVVDAPLWRDEILGKAESLKPAMLSYMESQVRKTGKMEHPDLIMYHSFHQHLNHLLPFLNNSSLAKAIFESCQLKRIFSDEYPKWLSVLRGYRNECKAVALNLLKSDRHSKRHGLDLINEFQLYDRETVDAVCEVALDDFLPILWLLSGQQFGEQAGTASDALMNPASDDERRKSTKMAVEWWNAYRVNMKPCDPVPLAVTGRKLLRQGLLCRVQSIRQTAIHRLVEAGDKSILTLEMNVVSNPRNVRRAYLFHPQETIDCLIGHECFDDFVRLTGVNMPDKAAWLKWWNKNRAAFDFGIADPSSIW